MTDNQITIEIPEQHDVLMNATQDGEAVVITVNQALQDFPHTAIFPWHLSVTLQVQGEVEFGMPTLEEHALLLQIGAEIEALILGGRTERGASNALFLSRSTSHGQRQLVYYVHDPEITHPALQALLDSRTWPRTWEYRMAHDAAWERAAFALGCFLQAPGAP